LNIIETQEIQRFTDKIHRLNLEKICRLNLEDDSFAAKTRLELFLAQIKALAGQVRGVG